MADNIVVMNQGKNPLVSYNFMLRVEGVFDIPCKAVHSFKKENEYEYIQEGGLNDYVHMRRKPISQPFTFTIERYVGTDYYDPLYNGAELVLPLILLVSRYNNKFEVTKRSYVFTGCTVMSKEYGELNGEKSGLHTETIVIGYREMLVVTNPADFPIGNWMDDRTSEASRKSTNTKFAVSYKDENAEDNNKFLNKGNWMSNRTDDASKKSSTNKYAKSYKDSTSEDNNKFLNKGNWMDDRGKDEASKKSTSVKYATNNKNDGDRYYKGNWINDVKNNNVNEKGVVEGYATRYEDNTSEDNNKFLNKGNWMSDRSENDSSTAVKYATRNVKDDERYRRGNWIKDKREYATRYKDNTSNDNNKFLNKGNWINDKGEYATRYKDNTSDDNNKFLNKGNWMSGRSENDSSTAVKYASRNVRDDERSRRGNWISDKGEYATRYKDNASEDNNKYLNKGNWMSGRSENDTATSVKYARQSAKDSDRAVPRKWPTVSSAKKIDSGDKK